MDFLAPGMLIGAVFLALPIIVHMIGRQRAKVVQFAAMDFLLGSKHRNAKRLRWHEWLVLLVRALICLAIPLILAKPFTSCEAHGPLVVRGPQAAVLVIDDSFASAHDSFGATLLERAKGQASSILDQLGPEADVAIVLTSEGAPSPTELSRDHIQIRDVLDDIDTTTRVADTTTALHRASQLLAASNHLRRTIYLLSPMAASGFRTVPAAAISGGIPGRNALFSADSGVELSIVDLTQGALPANLAVTDIRVERDVGAGSRGIEVTATVSNFGDQAALAHEISLHIDDAVVATGTIAVPPLSKVEKRFIAAVPGASRFADVMVEIGRDSLDIDNRRYLRTELREEVRVLLVDGDPRTIRYEDELFYLTAALRPGDRGDSGTILSTCTVDELDRLQLDEFDVIALVNVRAMDEIRVARLSSWVQDGGGLLVAAGANVDADAYNMTMISLLPQAVKDAIVVAYGSRGNERAERALRLSKWEAEHPIFSVFGSDGGGLRDARFDTVLLLGPTTRVDERRVLARYTNGAAALVESRSGDGRLLLFTSTLDRDWNDLAIHPGYLPLWQQVVRYLARKQDQRSRVQTLVGKGALLSLSDSDTRLEITGPGGVSSVIEGDELEGRRYVRFGGTLEPGLYRVSAVDEQAETQRRVEADFAVNLDSRGSDYAPVDLQVLIPPERAGASVNAATHQRRVELWHALAIGLLLLLLVESVLVMR